jgi:multidrug resistance efflux pump
MSEATVKPMQKAKANRRKLLLAAGSVFTIIAIGYGAWWFAYARQY